MAIVKDPNPKIVEVNAESIIVSLNIYDFDIADEVDVWFEYSVGTTEVDKDGEVVEVLSEPIGRSERETFTVAPNPDDQDDFITAEHTLEIHPGTLDQQLLPDTDYYIQGWVEAR